MDVPYYYYVNAVMAGMWCLPFTVFFVLSFFLARRKGDPARVAVLLLKILLPFAILCTIFHVVNVATAIIIAQDRSYYRSRLSRQDRLNLEWLNFRSSLVRYVFEEITTALILFTFVELGNGFMYARSHQRTIRQKIFRYLSLFLALLIIAIALGYTIRYSVLYGRYLSDGRVGYNNISRGLAMLEKLYSARTILVWIFTIPPIAYAAVAVHFWKTQPLVRGITVEFLIATILMFIRATYEFVYVVRYRIDIPEGSRLPLPVHNYLSPIFRFVPLGVTVVLLFVIAIRKKKGLWTTQQPFHHGGIGTGNHSVQQHGNGQPAGWQPQQPQPVHEVKPPGYY
ncbi:hypothetical protein MAPG_00817 [Magnaporthiopsis poae ATCC 64411]|uniref:Integral membrane protein n=1 Tax=Magnaporthiopsis poae (strain ATCC 64411 / 73-15) TaxID=644358 RepID=A0A0C4DM16_MAGP6|nr:hypothetical protein MAPG_00817 [Magnaporthiopsis poae ATCC 64411]